MIVFIVMAVGVVITVLAFYILMLSIYLLVQKNSEKLETLLLIGYSPSGVALPYQCLTALLNLIAFLSAMALLVVLRGRYLQALYQLFPDLSEPSVSPSFILGLAILALVAILNFIVIRRKIARLWNNKE